MMFSVHRDKRDRMRNKLDFYDSNLFAYGVMLNSFLIICTSFVQFCYYLAKILNLYFHSWSEKIITSWVGFKFPNFVVFLFQKSTAGKNGALSRFSVKHPLPTPNTVFDRILGPHSFSYTSRNIKQASLSDPLRAPVSFQFCLPTPTAERFCWKWLQKSTFSNKVFWRLDFFGKARK